MVSRLAMRLIVVLGSLVCAGVAPAQDRIHAFLNDTALQVQASESPTQKREILNRRLGAMIQAIDTVQRSALVSKQDEVGLTRLEANLREKTAELAGTDGFDPVPDDQLNAFATYAVQDTEQADQTLHISLVTLLLIIIIIILIA